MKKILFILTILTSALFFISCSKSDPGPAPATGNTNPVVRFEFTSDISATYPLQGTAGTAAFNDITTGTTWSKTMTAVRSGSGADSASLIVTPPAAWENTPTTANVTLKIFVDNVQKATKSFPLVWLDRAGNYEVRTKF